jgi:SdrD B-like domain/HYR domain/Secretion system C-terminal sorting domain/PA14 domain
VFNDANGDGIRNTNETGIEGVSMTLFTASGQWAGWTQSAADGSYSFTAAAGSQYSVCFNLHWAYQNFSTPNLGGNDNLDSDAVPAGGNACTGNVASGAGNVDCGMTNMSTPQNCPKSWVPTSSNIVCNNNGTPNNPNDDTFTFTLIVNLTSGVQDWGWETQGIPASLMAHYGDPYTMGPYPISNGPVVLSVTDVDYTPAAYPACVAQILTVTPPATCSGTLPSSVAINCPANMTMAATSAAGAMVSYSMPTASSTNCAGQPSVTKTAGLASGEMFPVGTTTVTYQATNSCGNVSVCSFTVTVTPYVATSGQSVGNFVFGDTNGNGIQDAGEPGLQYIGVTLFNAAGGWIGWAGTDANGNYNFNSASNANLVPGSYKVCINAPWNYPFATIKDAGSNDAIDSDLNASVGGTSCTDLFTVAAGQNLTTIDAGFSTGVVQPTCSISATASASVCNDNGTSTNAADDTYTFTATVTSNGSCTGTWSNGTMSGSYGVATTFGPYAISGGNKTLIFTSSTGQTTTVTGIAPAPCSTAPVCNNVTSGGFITKACVSGQVSFSNVTLPSGGNTNAIEYVWLSGTTGCAPSSMTQIANSNSATLTVANPSQTTYFIRCSRRAGCTAYDGESNCITVGANECGTTTCNNVTSGGTIAKSCVAGQVSFSSVALPTGGNTNAVEYVWLRGTTGCTPSSMTQIANSNSTTLTVANPTVTTYFIRCSRRAGCTNYDGESNCITVMANECPGVVSSVSLTCANNISIAATSAAGAVATYSAPTATNTNCAGTPSVVMTAGMASGMTFPVGTTTVSYSATNTCGNVANCSFTVTVTPLVSTGQSIGNFVFGDTNSNGIQDAGEPGLPYIGVTLFNAAGGWIGWAGTDVNGNYSFTSASNANLVPGSYKVCINAPWNYPSATIKDAGTNDAIDSDLNPTAGGTSCTDLFTLAAGQNITTIDAGFTTGVVQPTCSISAVSSNVVCNNNGTASNPADDTYTFSVTVSSNGSCAGTWTGGGLSGAYGTTANFGPYAISGGNQNLTFTSSTGQTTAVTVVAPATCSSVVNSSVAISCPANITVVANGTSGAVVNFSAPTATNTNCAGTPTVAQTGGLTSGSLFPLGTVTVSYQATNACGNVATCSFTVTVTPQVSTGQSIGDKVFNDTNGNGIQDADEPGISSIGVTIFNAAGGWIGWVGTDADGMYSFNSTTTPNLVPGQYKVCVSAPWNAPTATVKDAGGNDATDSDVNAVSGGTACTDLITLAAGQNITTVDAGFTSVVQPSCTITASGTTFCNNNGTPSNPADDTYTYVATVNSNGCTGNWTGGGQSGAYGSTATFGPYQISGGNQTLTFTSSTGQSVSVTAIAPAACSTAPVCAITAVVSNAVCNNNGTVSNPADDTYTFSVTVNSNGSCAGNWTGGGQSGAYGTSATFGPYAIAAGNQVLTFTSSTGQSVSVTAIAPTTCSSAPVCAITATVANAVCNNNGTASNPADDTYTFSVTVNSNGSCAGTWTGGGQSGAYGVATTFGPYAIASGNQNLTFISSTGQTTSATAVAPATCSAAPICNANRTIANNVEGAHCPTTGPTYGMFLNDVWPGLGVAGRYYTLSNGNFTENSDGTATFTATATNQVNTGIVFSVSATLCGRTYNAPVNSPKLPTCYVANASNWYYYTSFCATLTGQNTAAGAVLKLTQNGPAFQVGVGANQNESAYFGASSWFNLGIQSAPSNGTALNPIGGGDFNFRLSGTATPPSCGTGTASCTPCTPVASCSNVTNGGTIAKSCSGSNSVLSSLTLPTGGNTAAAIEYLWLKSTTTCTASNMTAIANSNTASYNAGVITQTTYFVRCSRRAGCTTYDGESACITVNANECSTSACVGSLGSMTREKWHNLAESVSDFGVIYSSSPTGTYVEYQYSGPANIADHYASRMRGFIRPTVSGYYKFLITGDNTTEFWINSNGTASSGKTKVCSIYGHTDEHELYKFASQTSVSIYLNANTDYYTELRHREITGGDHFNVRWSTPNNGSFVTIPGSNMKPWSCAWNAQLAAQSMALELTQTIGNVQLQWAANNGTQNDGFFVERMDMNTGEFDIIGYQAATKADDNAHLFNFTDEQPLVGENRYRVRLKQNDGAELLTQEQIAIVTDIEGVAVFPNPARSEVFVSMTRYMDQTATISMTDAMGRNVYAETIEEVASETHKISVQDLPEGTYFMVIRAEGFRDVIRPVLIRR